jgi:hypothetical protein
MPARPSNIGGTQDILPTVNQLIRELQIRVDSLNKILPIHRTVAATGTLNFGSIPAGSSVERTIQVAGARQNGTAFASPQLEPGAHLMWSAKITGTGIVTVRLVNPTSAPITANTVVWNATVSQ